MKKAILTLIISSLIILPFANVLAYGTDYRYTGKPYDPAADLYDYGARNYQPDIGRFIQQDPVQLNLSNPQKLKEMTGQDLDQFLQNPQNFNSYSYVQNNPVKYTDPTGEFSFTAVGIAAGGVVGMAYSYKNVGSYLRNVLRGNFNAAGDDAQVFLNTTKNGVIIGGSIGLAIDMAWGLIGLGLTVAPQSQQLISKVRDITLTGKYEPPYLKKLQITFQYLQEKGINIGEHALNSMFKKDFSVRQIEDVYNAGIKFLDKKYGNLNFIKDGIRIIIDPGNQNKIENVLDIKNINPDRFIQLLK